MSAFASPAADAFLTDSTERRARGVIQALFDFNCPSMLDAPPAPPSGKGGCP